MILLFALVYIAIGITGAALSGRVVDAMKLYRLSAPVAFVIISLSSMVEAMLVLAVASWVLR